MPTRSFATGCPSRVGSIMTAPASWRAFLAGHGRRRAHLARWPAPARDRAPGLAAIASEIEQRADGLVDLPVARPCAAPAARLLGSYDPVSWLDIARVAARPHEGAVTSTLFRPFALVRGRAAALWNLAAARSRSSRFGAVA